MKILHECSNGESIVIADDRNYAIGKVIETKNGDTLTQSSYFSSLSDAVREACRREANANCNDLSDWIIEFKKAMHYFDSVITSKL